MNSPELLTPWVAPLGWLALEAAVVVLAALAVQPLLRAAATRRSLWRAVLVTLGLLLAAEFTGATNQFSAQLRLAWQTTFPKPVLPPAPHPSLTESPSIPPPVSPLAPIGGEGRDEGAVPAPDALPSALEPAVAPSPHRSITSSTPSLWPAAVWLTGLAALLARAAWTHAGFAWLRLRHFIPAAEALRARVQTLAARLGLRRRVRVLASERLRAPAAFGWVRPGVGVPGDFTARFAPAQQDVMLAHELAHLAARDPLWQLLADLVTAALWWHPLAWVARRQHRIAGELAADDASLALPDGPVVLAECLLTLGHEATGCPRAALGMAGFRSQLGRRVERLLALPRRDWQAPSSARLALQTTVALLALAALALLPGCAANRTASEAPSGLVAKSWQAKTANAAAPAEAERTRRKMETTLAELERRHHEQNEELRREGKSLSDAGPSTVRYDMLIEEIRKRLASLPPAPPVGDDVRSLQSNAEPGTRNAEPSQRLVTSSPTPEAEALRRQERKVALDKLLGEAGQFQKVKSWTNAVMRYEEAVGHAKVLGGVETVEKQYRDALAGLTHCRIQLAVALQEKYEFKAAAAEVDKILPFAPRSAEAEQFKRFNERVEAAHKNRPAPRTPPAERAEVLRLVRDGRLHYEMGDLQKARTLLEEAIAKDPVNEAAYYYLRLIQESQFERESKVREKTYGDRVVEVTKKWNEKARADLPVPNPYYRTNSQVPFLTHSSKGAQRINRKLEEIVLPEVHFDGVPLAEVVKRLSADAVKFDPEPDPKKRGLNFLINDVSPQLPLLDAAGNPVPAARPVLLSEGLIRVGQPLKNLTLRQALDVICKTAELPTQFSVEEYAIAFIPRGPVAYYSRTFRVNPDTFMQGLQGVVGNPVVGQSVPAASLGGQAPTTTGPVRATVPAIVPATQRTAAEANALVRQFFQRAGVASLSATNGSTRVTFNPENGLLLVRGTTNDLRVIEQVIQKVQPPLLTPTNSAPRTALPNPIYKTNNSAPFLTHGSKGAQIINRKLDEIVLPEIHFDSVTLPMVVKWLDANVKKLDTETDPRRKGLNFLINNVVSDYISLNDGKSGKSVAPVLDPMGNPIVSPAGKPAKPDLENALIKVTKPLKDLTLRQVLDVICKTATVKMPDGRTVGLKSTVEEYAIVFSPKLPEQASLFARTFKVDPEMFIRGLRSVTEPVPVPKSNGASTGGRLPVPAGKTALGGVIGTNTINELNRMLRDFFFAVGVTNLGETNGPDATQVFFNDRTGLLLVRASLQDLGIIQQAIELLNNKPPQVLIEAKLVMFDQSENTALGFDWFTAKAVIDHPLPANPTGVFPLPASPSGTPTVTGSVTNNLSRTNAAPVATITGILTAPQFAVVMRALEQRDPASVRSLPKLTTPSGKQAVLELPAAAKAEGGFAQGLKLEVLPSVDANGYTISFTIIVTRDGKQVLESRGIVWDAQTLMVGGLELPGAAAKPGAKPPRLVLFLTPTLVDAAGNRIHATTDEMPFAPATSPQPKAAPPGK